MTAAAALAVRLYSRAPTSERLLLFMLATYIDDDSASCVCSFPQLSADLGVSDRQIRNLVNALTDSGELGVIKGNGRGQQTRFTLACVEKMSIERGKPSTPFKQKRGKYTAPFSEIKGEVFSTLSENKRGKPSTPFSEPKPKRGKPSTPFNPDSGAEIAERGKPSTPLVHSSKENTKTAPAALNKTSISNNSIPARALREYEENSISLPTHLLELEGFARAWSEWLEWKGEPYRNSPVILRAALEMLGKQTDPLEVLTYALTNGRDTLTARPEKGSARAGRRPRTVAEANATALETAQTTYEALENDDTTLF